MSWSLKQMFGGRRELEAVIDRRDATILRLRAAEDRLNQELNHARRELAEERGKTQAAMVKYAEACTGRDDAERSLITARADVKELTGQREDQAAQIEELRRDLADAQATIEGLGMRNTEVEKLLEHKQFLDEDRAHARRMDGEPDQ